MISEVIELLKCSSKLFSRRNRQYFYPNIKVLLNSRFFDEASLFRLLSQPSSLQFPKNKFIDYGVTLRNDYYPNDSLSVKLMVEDELKDVRFPYKEIINYSNSDCRISLSQTELTEEFALSDSLIAETENAFEMFTHERNISSNDISLRIKELVAMPQGGFRCVLQKAHYYDQIRTNLTIDCQLGGLQEDTLRTRDFGRDRSLRPFDQSILTNTIGACAVWVMSRRSTISQKGGKYFYLLPRKKNTGIYNGMLGTISGVVKAPACDKFSTSTLEDYIAGEVRREFYEETGVDSLIKRGSLSENDIQIIPLAFTRDLVRGGKPQFFFLISTPYLAQSELKYAFRNSFNGNEEFEDSCLSHLPTFKVSVETYLNFLYALAYIQRNRRLGYVDLRPA